MAVSPYTSQFQNARSDLENRIKDGRVKDRNDIEEFLRSRQLTLEDFEKAEEEYQSALKTGEASNLPGTVASRVAGSALGSVGKFAEAIGDVVAPETTSKVRKSIENKLSERTRQELFDPTSGGIVESFAQFGAGILGPAKFTGAATRALPLVKKLPQFVRGSFSFGVGETFAVRPEENLINMLIEAKPELEPYFAKLKVNPDDTKAQQQVDAIIGNTLTAGGFGAAITGIFKTGKGSFRLVNKLLKKTGVDVDGIVKSRFTSRFGLTDKTLSSQLKRQYATKRAVEEARGGIDDLERIARREKASDAVITEALAGDPRSLTLLRNNHPKTFLKVQDMRLNIDKLSDYARDNIALASSMTVKRGDTLEAIAQKLDVPLKTIQKLNPNVVNENIANGQVKKIAIPGELQIVIDKNRGSYVNRTYRVFEDPNFKASPEVQQKAREYLASKGLDEQEINSTITYLTKQMTEPDVVSLIGRDLPGKTSKIFKKRDLNIAKPIRDLWGEVKDPYKNYARTYTKLSRLVAEHKYLSQLAKDGVKEGKILNQYTDSIANKELTAIGEKALGISAGVRGGLDNPLKGLFADNAFAQGLADGTEVMFGRDNQMLNAFLGLKTLSQAGATIGSIPTHGRNIMGNVFIMMANATLNPINGYRAMKDTMKRFSSGSDQEFRNRMGRYIELGILDSSTSAETLKAIAGQAFKEGPTGFAERTALGRIGKKGVQGLTRVYEAEDNVFKIWNFEQVKNQFRKALPNFSEEAVEEIAAQRTRDMMPNYGLIPKSVKYLRYTPFGNFTAFPTEILRTSKNLIKNTWKDITGVTAKELGVTDPRSVAAIRAMGQKRLGGMTVAALATDYAAETTKQAFGITEEDARDIDNVGSSWRKGTAKFFLSNIYDEPGTGKKKVNYIDAGPIDPYSYLKIPMRKLTNLIKNGDEYNEAQVDEIMVDSVLDLLSPFVTPSMITEAIIKGTQKAERDDPISTKIRDTFTEVLGALNPGTVRFILKRLEYEQQRGQFPEDVTPTNRYGYALPKGEVDFAAFMGVKRSEQDLTKSFSSNVQPLLKLMDRAGNNFIKVVQDYRGQDSEKVIEAFTESQELNRRASQKLKAILDSYYRLGFTERDMRDAFTDKGIKGSKPADIKKIMKVLNNQLDPVDIPGLAIRQSITPGGTGVSLPMNELVNIMEQYRQMGID
jgi:LysM repeat protein